MVVEQPWSMHFLLLCSNGENNMYCLNGQQQRGSKSSPLTNSLQLFKTWRVTSQYHNIVDKRLCQILSCMCCSACKRSWLTANEVAICLLPHSLPVLNSIIIINSQSKVINQLIDQLINPSVNSPFSYQLELTIETLLLSIMEVIDIYQLFG